MAVRATANFTNRMNDRHKRHQASGVIPEGALTPEHTPLYQQLKLMILEHIRSGEWPRDHRVPSESELVRQHGVSRMTANRALRELTGEGFLRRVQGVGTFVADAPPQSALVKVRDIAEEIAARGHRHSAEVVRIAAEPASIEVADRFGIQAGARVFHSILVHCENDVPVQLEDRYVAPSLVPGYLDQDFTRRTPHAYLMAQAPLSEAEHVIEAVLPERWEQRLLRLVQPEACLLLRRRTWSGGQLASQARLLFPGSRYRLGEHFLPRG